MMKSDLEYSKLGCSNRTKFCCMKVSAGQHFRRIFYTARYRLEQCRCFANYFKQNHPLATSFMLIIALITLNHGRFSS